MAAQPSTSTRGALAERGTPLRWRSVPLILMYHSVGRVDDDPYLLTVSPPRFAQQMAELARRGLRGVGVGALMEAVRAGRHRRLVGLTFDDGYVDVLDEALPALRRHGFTGTMFAVADRLGGRNDWDEGPARPLLDADGLRELAAAGVEIGSHGLTHLRLAGCDPGRLRSEVGESRERLADVVGRPVTGFAYPYGDMDAAARAAVQAAGYAYACAVTTPRRCLGPMALPRLYAGDRDTPVRLALKRHLYRIYIPLRGGAR